MNRPVLDASLLLALAASLPAYANDTVTPNAADNPAASIAPTPKLPDVVAPAPSVPAPDTQPTIRGGSQDPVVGPATPTVSTQAILSPKLLFGNLQRESDEFSLVNDKSRISFHKPMYVMPATYSNRYDGSESEFVFQISFKLHLLSNFYFAYTQRSFWQIYNEDESRPFRATDYNPELFYRWKPAFDFCPRCGFDVGIEHQSNGRDVPQSRSWNRLDFAAYHEWNRTLVYLKTWYRIPEKSKKSPDDPKGDDNPDIAHYYGYGELRVQQELFDQHHASLMLRGNPSTGKGAIEFNYSVPFGDYLYWNVYVFNGYGDSLIDYNHSVTRVGIGIMLAR
ncbi:phospholipase A [Solimonas marina]|uniref:Phospholipase A1 n=1 Tax=Solimonas marina TaxID=2714601 RepID=A0A970B4W9_9GAMM|nr:phospholipase A [Solimonas marina]NKF22762.1 phospholipase [Solimonas marina]